MANQKDPTRSPAWKRPSDVMKVRLKKRRTSSVENFQSLAAKAAVKGRLSSSEDSAGNRPEKRRNPFGQDGGPPARRRASQNRNVEDDSGRRASDGYAEGASSRRQEEDAVGGAGEEGGGAKGVGLFQALDSEDEVHTCKNLKVPISHNSLNLKKFYVSSFSQLSSFNYIMSKL